MFLNRTQAHSLVRQEKFKDYPQASVSAEKRLESEIGPGRIIGKPKSRKGA
jgi:hypothetical protein